MKKQPRNSRQISSHEPAVGQSFNVNPFSEFLSIPKSSEHQQTKSSEAKPAVSVVELNCWENSFKIYDLSSLIKLSAI